jgi:hypothetical protein
VGDLYYTILSTFTFKRAPGFGKIIAPSVDPIVEKYQILIEHCDHFIEQMNQPIPPTKNQPGETSIRTFIQSLPNSNLFDMFLDIGFGSCPHSCELFPRIFDLFVENGVNTGRQPISKLYVVNAIEFGFYSIIKWLIKSRHADATETLMTFCKSALNTDDFELVELLLSCGADVYKKDVYNWNSVMYAIHNKNTEIVDMLLERCGNIIMQGMLSLKRLGLNSDVRDHVFKVMGVLDDRWRFQSLCGLDLATMFNWGVMRDNRDGLYNDSFMNVYDNGFGGLISPPWEFTSSADFRELKVNNVDEALGAALAIYHEGWTKHFIRMGARVDWDDLIHDSDKINVLVKAGATNPAYTEQIQEITENYDSGFNNYLNEMRMMADIDSPTLDPLEPAIRYRSSSQRINLWGELAFQIPPNIPAYVWPE